VLYFVSHTHKYSSLFGKIQDTPRIEVFGAKRAQVQNRTIGMLKE